MMFKHLMRLGQLLLVSATFCPTSQAQRPCSTAEPLHADETVAWLHAKNRSIPFQDAPELVALAVKKRISGLAVFQLDVDAGGHVIAVSPLSGPHQLTDIYGDVAKQISFYPFRENGRPVCARFTWRYAGGLLHVDNPDAKIEDKFNHLFNKCSALSAAKSEAEALLTCRLAADVADRLSAPRNNKSRVVAYTNYASVLILGNRPGEALTYAEKAVKASDLGFLDVSDKATAYGLRGEARGLTGDTQGADEDSARAEELERATFEFPRTSEQRKFDSHMLRSVLNFHAEILTGMGKKAEADKLLDEAQKL
jgi:tetratricopeptide (TPR) repeat protein